LNLGFGVAGSKDAAPCPDVISNLDSQCHIRFHENINTRSELDQANALSALQRVAGTFPEYYSAREYSSNLLDHDLTLLTLEGENVLLVFNRGGFP
jgi:hypothetical protein